MHTVGVGVVSSHHISELTRVGFLLQAHVDMEESKRQISRCPPRLVGPNARPCPLGPHNPLIPRSLVMPIHWRAPSVPAPRSSSPAQRSPAR